MSIPGLRPGEELDCAVKVRYHHPEQKARICMQENGLVKVLFDEEVRAPSPGQSAVFYDEEDCVIGGGIICCGCDGEDRSGAFVRKSGTK